MHKAPSGKHWQARDKPASLANVTFVVVEIFSTR